MYISRVNSYSQSATGKSLKTRKFILFQCFAIALQLLKLSLVWLGSEERIFAELISNTNLPYTMLYLIETLTLDKGGNQVDTRHRFSFDTMSYDVERYRIDVETKSCVYRELIFYFKI